MKISLITGVLSQTLSSNQRFQILSLVHTLRLLLRFVCAVQDVAAKTLRVDRKTAQIFGQKEDCAVAAITELMSIVFRELRRQVGTCRRLLSFVDHLFTQLS